jgi:hypothetical protein
MERMTMKARVRFLVEMDLPDTWGEDCTAGQVVKQAIQSVENRVRIAENPQPHQRPLDGARIIGRPQVDVVIITKR